MNNYPQTKLTADGTTSLSLAPGEYSVFAVGNFGGGTLDIKWKAGNKTAVTYPDGSFTESGGLIIAVGADRVDIELSGATSPSIEIRINRIIPQT